MGAPFGAGPRRSASPHLDRSFIGAKRSCRTALRQCDATGLASTEVSELLLEAFVVVENLRPLMRLIVHDASVRQVAGRKQPERADCSSHPEG